MNEAFELEFRHWTITGWSEWKFSRAYKTEKAMLAGLEELTKDKRFEYRRKK